MDLKNLWEDFSATWKAVMTSPEAFFAGWDSTEEWQRPALFVALCGAIAGVVLTVLTFGLAVGKIIFFPFFLLFLTVLGGVVLFVCARLLGGKGDIEATIKMVGYTHAVSVLSFGVPFLGVIGAFYQLWLLVAGTKAVHKMETGKAALAVLVPVVLLWMFLLLVGAGFLALLAVLTGT